MESLKLNDQRSKTAQLLVWLVTALELATLISAFFQYQLLDAIANGEDITTEQASSNDTRQQVLAVVFLIAYIFSGVTFILWFRRAYFNLHTKTSNLSYSEGWAAGAWFVPVVNLFYPYKIMKDLYVETENILVRRMENYSARTSTTFLGWWWGLWIASGVIGQFTFRYSLRAKQVDELIFVTEIDMIGSVISLILGIITIKVIRDYSSIEPLLFELKEEVKPADTIQLIPEIRTLNEKKLIGKKFIMSFALNTTFELWSNFMPRRKEIQNNIGTDLYSMQIYPKGFFEKFDPKAQFEKWAAIEVKDLGTIPNEMEGFTLPGGLYAVFLYKGLQSQASPTFEYIFKTWFPNSEYDLDDRPHFEIMGEKYKKDDPSSEEEFWIPVKLKN